MSNPWKPFMEGTNGPDDEWPANEVCSVVEHYAATEGHTSIWWGVRQVIERARTEYADLVDGLKQQQAQHDATNRFHRDRIKEADSEVLRLQVKVDMLQKQLESVQDGHAEPRQP